MFDQAAHASVQDEGTKMPEPFESKMAQQILANNRGHYRMSNFQLAAKSDTEQRRMNITYGPSRRTILDNQIMKLQGEIKDASRGLNVIESRCVVGQ